MNEAGQPRSLLKTMRCPCYYTALQTATKIKIDGKERRLGEGGGGGGGRKGGVEEKRKEESIQKELIEYQG